VAVETERDPQTVGELVRFWRTQRRLTQMELALDANLSTEHLSFVETGRWRPSRQLLVHLAQHLDVPIAHPDGRDLRPTLALGRVEGTRTRRGR
jgi:transcriptional regulator with XRE-family HTH domain